MSPMFDLARVKEHPLTADEAAQVFGQLLSGHATEDEILAFLIALSARKPSTAEFVGAVAAMKSQMKAIAAPPMAIDLCGTGGDGLGTLNISTAVSFVVAAAGVPVAKHGNRALSSKSGAAECLQALGVKIDLAPEQISACVRDAGIGFMFAPAHHPAMKHVGPARAELGTRTMFNLLGPQSNPAGVKHYMLGVYDRKWAEPVAAALLANRATDAWVVHGSDGLDEVTTTGPTFVASIKAGNLTSFEVTPEDAGLPRSRPQDLKGGDPSYNAAALLALLEGKRGAYRDVVLMNAGAAFVVADRAENLAGGVALAADAIDSARARATLRKLVAVSNA
jgi:anthranilate phosphoribosyltransferase